MASAIIDSAGIVECFKANVQDFESIWELIQKTGDQTDRWVSKKGRLIREIEILGIFILNVRPKSPCIW